MDEDAVTTGAKGPNPLYASFVERCRRAAEAEDVEARAARWRDASLEERARVGIGLMRLADKILRSRPDPYVRPPLTGRITSIKRD
jgi:hypothetical protein